MAKKKISSQDFLNLMDEQESRLEKPAFNPAQKITPKKTKKKTRIALFGGRYTLTPVQEEWFQFAVAKTPRFVKKLATSPAARKLVSRVETRLSRLLRS